MVTANGCVIFRERSNTRNFHKLLKSGSNDRCRESFKHHIHGMGPVYKSQFKTFKEEDDEFAATLRKAELLDYNNCMWLSSGGASSPSSCFQQNYISGYMDLKIDAWFISLLSTRSANILSTKAAFFDGSRVNPIEEASSVLDQRKLLEENLVFQENLEEEEEEEEVVSWLATSIENDSSSVSSITDSSDDQSLFSSCSSSDYSYAAEVVDLEEIGNDKPLFWPSDWTSDWDSETKRDLLIMSPRRDTYKLDSDKGCSKRLVFGTQPKSSANLDLKNANGINDVRRIRNKPPRFKKPTKTSTKIVPLVDEADLEGLIEAKVFNEREPRDIWTKTPVFWPSECASEWGSDAKLDFFVMSPRKDIYSFSKSPKTSPDTLRFRVVNGNMGLEKGCSRRLEFSSCKKPAAIGVEHERTEVKPLTTKSVNKHRIVLEDLFLVDKLNVEGAIEEALGLDEFDGHEGLESDFNKDEFSLVEII